MSQASHQHPRTRDTVALLLNLVCPGSGLILLRREWLGFSIVMLTTMLAFATIVGLWVVPADAPRWLTWGSLGGLVAVWLLAQGVTLRRRRQIRSPLLAAEVRDLCRRGAAALAEGDLETAQQCLIVALSVDDEDPDALVHWAQVMEQLPKPRAARTAWRRVLAVSQNPAVRATARDALQRRP